MTARCPPGTTAAPRWRTIGRMQFLHTMLRVGNLQRSIDFYTQVLGMELLRTSENPEYRYSLAFLGFGGGNGILGRIHCLGEVTAVACLPIGILHVFCALGFLAGCESKQKGWQDENEF